MGRGANGWGWDRMNGDVDVFNERGAIIGWGMVVVVDSILM